VNAGPLVNGPENGSYPFLTRDGLQLVYGKDPGPLGGWDLYISSRDTIDEPFGKPRHLGTNVNSAGHDSHGWLSPDGSAIYFESDREGPGRYDIYRSVRENAIPDKASQTR